MRVSEPSIFFLAAYYNMSTFSVKNRDTRKRRGFLLELSPYARDGQPNQEHGADARWIDTETGLSINVYAVRYKVNHPKGEGMLGCNDGSEPIMVCSHGCEAVREADRARILTSSRCGRQLLRTWKPESRTGIKSFSSWSMGAEH